MTRIAPIVQTITRGILFMGIAVGISRSITECRADPPDAPANSVSFGPLLKAFERCSLVLDDDHATQAQKSIALTELARIAGLDSKIASGSRKSPPKRQVDLSVEALKLLAEQAAKGLPPLNYLAVDGIASTGIKGVKPLLEMLPETAADADPFILLGVVNGLSSATSALSAKTDIASQAQLAQIVAACRKLATDSGAILVLQSASVNVISQALSAKGAGFERAVIASTNVMSNSPKAAVRSQAFAGIVKAANALLVDNGKGIFSVSDTVGFNAVLDNLGNAAESTSDDGSLLDDLLRAAASDAVVSFAGNAPYLPKIYGPPTPATPTPTPTPKPATANAGAASIMQPIAVSDIPSATGDGVLFAGSSNGVAGISGVSATRGYISTYDGYPSKGHAYPTGGRRMSGSGGKLGLDPLASNNKQVGGAGASGGTGAQRRSLNAPKSPPGLTPITQTPSTAKQPPK